MKLKNALLRLALALGIILSLVGGASAQTPRQPPLPPGYQPNYPLTEPSLVPQPVIQAPYIPTSTIDVPLDIVLVQDETGSMADDIGNLRALTPQIWDSIAAISTAGFQMSVIGFRDFGLYPWGVSGDWVYRRLGDFTTSRNDYQTMVNGLTASGGEDIPESQYATLNYLLTPSHSCLDSNRDGDCVDSNDTQTGQQPNFRSGSVRVILLATDANFHTPDLDSNYPGPTRNAVVQALQANRVIVIGLVPGGAGQVSEVDDLASSTGGSTQDTGSSGQDIANAIAQALEGIRPVDPVSSTLSVNPNNLVADGTSSAAITVTLRDTAGQPVAGKMVMLYSSRSSVDVFTPFYGETDAEGNFYAQLTSTLPGRAQISATNFTDNISLSTTANVDFTAQDNTAAADLLFKMNRLDKLSRQEMDELGRIALQVGADGDYFQQAIGADSAKIAIDGFLGFVGHQSIVNEMSRPAVQLALPGMERGWKDIFQLKYSVADQFKDAGNLFDTYWQQAIQTSDFSSLSLPVLLGGTKYYAARFRDDVVENITTDMILDSWKRLGENPFGMSFAANYFAADASIVQGDLSRMYEQAVLYGVPPLSEADQKAFANDLLKRALAPQALTDVHSQQAMLLSSLRDSHDSLGGGWDVFVLKFIAEMLGGSFGPQGALLVHDINTAMEVYFDGVKLGTAQQAYNYAPGVLKSVSESGAKIYKNASTAYERLSLSQLPQTPAGEITAIRNYSAGWGLGPVWSERASYSDIDIHNTGTEPAVYNLIVRYGYNSQLLGLPWAYLPLVRGDAVTLGPGETATVRFYYKREEQGGSPNSDSTIYAEAIASNDTGFFYIDSYSEQWQPQRVSPSSWMVPAKLQALGVSQEMAAIQADDIPTIENPIDTYLVNGLQNGVYQAQIWLANPFNGTIAAHVTQLLPDGVIVLDSDGLQAGQTLTWDVSIPASDILALHFTFKHPAVPGAEIVLPAAQMSFQEPSSGETLTTYSNDAEFTGQWPVEVRASAPIGQEGTESSLAVTVTNITDAPASGAITVKIPSSSGGTLRTQTLPFTTDSAGTATLSFVLPADLPAGLNLVQVWLEIGSASKQVAMETYRVQGAQGTRLLLPLISNQNLYTNTKITFVSERDGDMDLYTMAPDGSNLKQITNSQGEEWNPSWSPDGRKITFSMFTLSNQDIYQINSDGTGLVNLTNAVGLDENPAWSPNGEYIVFDSNRSGNREIYLMKADGTGLKKLTNNAVDDWDPSWSPDGAKIIYGSGDFSGGNICIMDAKDGSGKTCLTNLNADSTPVFSPNGKFITFHSDRSGDWEIYIMNSDGSGIKNITNMPGKDRLASWSPDGKMIVFTSERDGDRELYIMNADGSGVIRLTNSPGWDWDPSWSPYT